MVTEPRGALTCRSLTLAVLANSGPFLDYYSPIWGPRAIFMVAEAQGVLRCHSSTLAILADSGPFHGILLIDLVFWSDFMVTEP